MKRNMLTFGNARTASKQGRPRIQSINHWRLKQKAIMSRSYTNHSNIE
jgi:hypothetical protein